MLDGVRLPFRPDSSAKGLFGHRSAACHTPGCVSRVYEVLNRTRGLTVAKIPNLDPYPGIPAEILILTAPPLSALEAGSH